MISLCPFSRRIIRCNLSCEFLSIHILFVLVKTNANHLFQHQDRTTGMKIPTTNNNLRRPLSTGVTNFVTKRNKQLYKIILPRNTTWRIIYERPSRHYRRNLLKLCPFLCNRKTNRSQINKVHRRQSYLCIAW